MSKPTEKAAMYLADYEAGMTHSEIARKHGVSRQRIQQVCGKYGPNHFIKVKPEQCVYPIWRKWMNDNKITRCELLRRIGLQTHTSNHYRLADYMRGVRYPQKPYIDKLLSATGLTYEQLFYRGD